MKITAKQIATGAILLAICIVSQFFKNTSIFITGPIINAALILAALYCGPIISIALCIITPITSFFITGSPVMAAIPAMFPCIMLGNIVLVLAVLLLKDKLGKKTGLVFSIGIGSVVKGLIMGLLISVVLLNVFGTHLPEMLQAKIPALKLQFSLFQLITALIGGVYAVIIFEALKKAGFYPQKDGEKK